MIDGIVDCTVDVVDSRKSDFWCVFSFLKKRLHHVVFWSAEVGCSLYLWIPSDGQPMVRPPFFTGITFYFAELPTVQLTLDGTLMGLRVPKAAVESSI